MFFEHGPQHATPHSCKASHGGSRRVIGRRRAGITRRLATRAEPDDWGGLQPHIPCHGDRARPESRRPGGGPGGEPGLGACIIRARTAGRPDAEAPATPENADETCTPRKGGVPAGATRRALAARPRRIGALRAKPGPSAPHAPQPPSPAPSTRRTNAHVLALLGGCSPCSGGAGPSWSTCCRRPCSWQARRHQSTSPPGSPAWTCGRIQTSRREPPAPGTLRRSREAVIALQHVGSTIAVGRAGGWEAGVVRPVVRAAPASGQHSGAEATEPTYKHGRTAGTAPGVGAVAGSK